MTTKDNTVSIVDKLTEVFEAESKKWSDAIIDQKRFAEILSKVPGTVEGLHRQNAIFHAKAEAFKYAVILVKQTLQNKEPRLSGEQAKKSLRALREALYQDQDKEKTT